MEVAFLDMHRNLPRHLFELEQAAKMQERVEIGGGWDDDAIEAFILKWSRKYNGEYASEDVALVLRTYGIDPSWLDDITRKTAIKQEKLSANKVLCDSADDLPF